MFLAPSDKFFSTRLDSIEDYHEVDVDFKRYSKNIMLDIEKNKIQFVNTKYSTERYLGIINNNDTIFIDRYKDSLYYGTLFNFINKKFKIDKGVFTDIDFWNNFELPKSDFNYPPIETKKIILNRKEYWVTSSMSGNKRKDTLCRYKDYWLKRKYNIISKKIEEGNRERNRLIVFVKNDENKWNGEKAIEEFKSIVINDSSIIVWDKIVVGMLKEELVKLIEFEEYHSEEKIITMYTQDFESKFLIKEDRVVQIEVNRRCK